MKASNLIWIIAVVVGIAITASAIKDPSTPKTIAAVAYDIVMPLAAYGIIKGKK